MGVCTQIVKPSFLSLKGARGAKEVVADTLAEWLRRRPAKPLGSPARVRISQVSLFLQSPLITHLKSAN